MAKGLDPETALFILEEYELRKWEDHKAQIAPPGKKIQVVHTGNIEKVKKKAKEVERRAHRQTLTAKYKRLERQIKRLEQLFERKEKKREKRNAGAG